MNGNPADGGTTVKINVWVLSTCIPSESRPCYPEVFGSEAEARTVFNARMQGEWECNAPCNDDGDAMEYPEGDPELAVHLIADEDPAGEWGRWDLTVHQIEVVEAQP